MKAFFAQIDWVRNTFFFVFYFFLVAGVFVGFVKPQLDVFRNTNANYRKELFTLEQIQKQRDLEKQSLAEYQKNNAEILEGFKYQITQQEIEEKLRIIFDTAGIVADGEPILEGDYWKQRYVISGKVKDIQALKKALEIAQNFKAIMRLNFPIHIESDVIKKGYQRAPHRSLLRATGLKDSDFNKPFIGVANSYIDIIPGHFYLNKYAEIIKDEIRKAGGVPFEFNTIGVDDGIAMGHNGMLYSLPSRELIADCIETVMNAHSLDAMICIPNCDKIVPGMLMGALRVNVPTIFVSGGPMKAGKLDDGSVLDLNSAFEAVGAYESGKIDEKRLHEIECNACPGGGSCSGMFTANSMNTLCEAMGVALPGNGTIPALSKEREELLRAAARRIVEIALDSEASERFRFRNILNHKAVHNAFVVDMAMGGSTNTVLHMLAIAKEAGVDFDLESINAIAAKVAHIAKIAPALSSVHMEDINRAGGVSAVMNEVAKRNSSLGMQCDKIVDFVRGTDAKSANLPQNPQNLHSHTANTRICGESVSESILYLDALTITSETLGERIKGAKITDTNIIHTNENAYSQVGGLKILFGNLACEGAVLKVAAVAESMKEFRGKAICFNSQEQAIKGIAGGKVKSGNDRRG